MRKLWKTNIIITSYEWLETEWRHRNNTERDTWVSERLDAAARCGRHHHGPDWQDDAAGREPGLRLGSESAGPHRVLAGQEEEGPRSPGHWPPPAPHSGSRGLTVTPGTPSSASVRGNLKPSLRSPAPRPNWVNHLNFVERLTNVSRVQKAELLTTVWILNTFYSESTVVKYFSVSARVWAGPD